MSDQLESATPAKVLTASDIRAALKLAYKAPEAVVGFEVANATGANARRHVDAVVMDLWPSRGLALTAVEIKISRGDFLRELKQPEKSEAIAKYCDFFVIAAPKGMVRADELPLAWGLWEVGADASLKVKVRPTRTEARDVDRHFLAAMVRAFSYADAAMVDAIIATRREVLEREYSEKNRGIHKRIQEQVAQRVGSDTGVKWAEFCESVGEGRHSITEVEAIQLFKVMRAIGYAKTWGGMKDWLDNMERTLTRGREIMASLTPAGQATSEDGV